MKIERKCPICGDSFTAIKQTQRFCHRRCFKRDYYQKTKIKKAEIESRLPDYKCPVCDNVSDVKFDPVKNENSFESLVCPFCGIPRSTVFKQSNNPKFYMGHSMTVQFVVKSAIVSKI